MKDQEGYSSTSNLIYNPKNERLGKILIFLPHGVSLTEAWLKEWKDI